MAEIAMAGILLCASYFDWKRKKIPNQLIAIGLLPVAGALAQGRDLQEIFWRILSMLFVFLICWHIYLSGGLGAGDGKLFIVLAGVCGLARLLYIAVIGFLLACIFSVAKILRSGDGISLVNNLLHPIRVRLGLAGACDMPQDRGQARHTVILAPFLAIGYLLVMAEGWWM